MTTKRSKPGPKPASPEQLKARGSWRYAARLKEQRELDLAEKRKARPAPRLRRLKITQAERLAHCRRHCPPAGPDGLCVHGHPAAPGAQPTTTGTGPGIGDDERPLEPNNR